MSGEPQVTFVVPARNNRGIIGATLNSIAQQTMRDFACLVIDGRSTDGTVEYVREHFPWATLIRKDADSGPAASRSIGMLRNRSPFIALVDSDVQLAPDWAEQQLLHFAGQARTGICGTRLLYGKNPDVLYASFGAMNRYGVSWDGGQGETVETHEETRRCLWCNTSALMLRREVVEQAGTFDDRMFAACEDSDFGWRANICGFEAAYNPAAVAIHDVHGSFHPKRQGDFLLYLLRRNRIRSLFVNYELSSLVQFALPYVGMALVDSMAGRPRRLKLKAIAWNVWHVRDTLRRRRDVQGRRKVKDEALWHLFAAGIRGPGGDALVRLENAARKLKEAAT